MAVCVIHFIKKVLTLLSSISADIVFICFKGLVIYGRTNAVMPEPGGPWGPLAPQYFADQLTLFHLGRADYPQSLLLAPPPIFFTVRHHC